jgi:hypothetical protein
MSNPAMEKALKSIEMSFSPERKAIENKLNAVTRCITMLEDPRWADRAFSLVTEYGISNKYDLGNTLIEIRTHEEKLVGHEYIVGADWNVAKIEKFSQRLKNI